MYAVNSNHTCCGPTDVLQTFGRLQTDSGRLFQIHEAAKVVMVLGIYSTWQSADHIPRWWRPAQQQSLNVSDAVIDWLNRKPIYDFLLVINCNLSSVSHRLRDRVLQRLKPTPNSTLHVVWSFWTSSSSLPCEKLRHWPTFEWNCVISVPVVLSQYTRVKTNDRQTTHDTSWQQPNFALLLQHWKVLYMFCDYVC